MEDDRRIDMTEVFLDYSVAIGDASSSACAPQGTGSDEEVNNQNPFLSGLERGNQENITNGSCNMQLCVKCRELKSFHKARLKDFKAILYKC